MSTWIIGAAFRSMLSGSLNTWLCRRGQVLGEAAVGVAAEQLAVRAQVRLADTAVETVAAIELGIDDDPLAGAERRCLPASTTSPAISCPMMRG